VTGTGVSSLIAFLSDETAREELLILDDSNASAHCSSARRADALRTCEI
jgi:hypothetical protein